MSGEALAASVFIITGIVTAVILANSFLPAAFQTSDISSVSSSDLNSKLSTSLSVISFSVNDDGTNTIADVYIQNTGTAVFSKDYLDRSVIYLGDEGKEMQTAIDLNSGSHTDSVFESRSELRNNTQTNLNRFGSGDILHITFKNKTGVLTASKGHRVHFSIALQNGYTLPYSYKV